MTDTQYLRDSWQPIPIGYDREWYAPGVGVRSRGKPRLYVKVGIAKSDALGTLTCRDTAVCVTMCYTLLFKSMSQFTTGCNDI